MAQTVGIGKQDFEKLRIGKNFYIDKTRFIMEWWGTDDEVTLITRPRRFGKTLNISMVEKFFSVKYAGQEELFRGLEVWSLLLASGYLKVKQFKAYMSDFGEWKQEYELQLTNFEVKTMFRNMVKKWFASAASN